MDNYDEIRYDIEKTESINKEILEAIPYEFPGKKTHVQISTPEFTSVCPWTGLPDFGDITVTYIPKENLVELKSLKYYLLSYRNVGILQEHIVNHVLDDLVQVIKPQYMKIEGYFNSRGGLDTRAIAEYGSLK